MTVILLHQCLFYNIKNENVFERRKIKNTSKKKIYNTFYENKKKEV